MRASHVNALITLGTIDWRSADPLAGLSDDERAVVSRASGSWQERSGYAAIQATRPQTLAYALNDSPVGLLAWQLEWFVDYDPTTSEQTPVDLDAVLADVTITWATQTAGSAARLYKESGSAFAGGPVSGVPTAVAVFRGMPRSAPWPSGPSTSCAGPSSNAAATSPPCRHPTCS